MKAEMADKVTTAINTVLDGLDDHIRDYISSVLADDPSQEPEELEGTIGPFLLSSEFAKDDDEVTALCKRLAEALSDANGGAKARPRKETDDTPMLLSAPVSFKESRNSMDDKLIDLMWGKDKVRQTMNSTFDRAKTTNSKRVQRQQQKLLKDAYESDEEEEQVSLMVLPDYSSGSGEKDINVLNFSLRFAGQELLASADLRLAYARRYGLVGKNGIGKTTLLKHIAAFEIEGFPRHHRVLHVKQEVRSSDKSVLEAVLQSDVERETLLDEEREILARQQRNKDGPGGASAGEAEEPSVMDVQADADRLNEIYSRLAIIGSNTAEARASVILNGLQFTPDMQAAPVSDLSGGWRMRVALASALFIEPDLLLLDEPTNHLDLEAVLWLQEYLKGYKHTVLLVSHDRAFLNEVVTDVVYFHDKTLTYYKGNYDTFENVREEKLKNQRRLFEANLAKRAHMQDFIDKFRYNANRAALVQSRIKALEKMEVVEEPQEEGKFSFHLPVPEPLGRPVLNIDGVGFAYPLRTVAAEGDGEGEEAAKAPAGPVQRGKVLFKDVNLGIDLETKIGIVGPNGAGKSTLLNLMLDKLRALDGNIFRHQNLRLASFTQHHNDQFDLKLSAAENFEAMFPKADTQELRSLLGRFGLSGDDAMRPMRFLSGGQKSRAAFALLAWRRPHIVILDEPTNHLDMNTIDALCEALKEFRGGLVVVSHDQHFISQVCSDIYVCGDGQVKRFPGSFADYRNSFLAKLRKAAGAGGK